MSNSQSDQHTTAPPHWTARLVVYSLSLLLATQPLMISAQTIVAGTTATTQTHAANGVPIINIATPSAKGVSHNQFQQFNVQQHGLILNNAKAITSTQLAGFVEANPNLQAGNAASLIINEVIEPHRSQLRGYTEVAGQAAAVMIANPYGITCNGCGFINTPRVTLTTGIPTVQNGALTSLSVRGGDIAIEGAGLNAGNVSQFDIITRAVTINADLHAQALELVLGTNRVDYPSLTATATATDSSVEFALDSSALGGMYANTIRLIGTEAGVGVRTLGNVASTAGQLTLSVDGKISVNSVQSAGNITLTSHSDDIELNQQLRSDDSIHLTAHDTIINKGITTAFNDITIDANNVMQQGTLASGVTIEKNEDDETTYLIDRPGKLSITATNELNNNGRLASGGELGIDAPTITNQETGHISSDQTLTMTGDRLTNQGNINSAGTLHIQLTGALVNSATIETAQSVELQAASFTNNQGTLTASGEQNSQITITSTLNNTDGTIESNAQDLSLTGSDIINDQGTITHAGEGTLTLAATDNAGTGLSNRRGNVASNNIVDITTGSANSRSDIDNTSGSISGAAITLKVKDITNNGGVIEGNTVDIQAQGNLENQRDNDDVSADNTGLISALGTEIDALKLTIIGWINNSDSIIQTNAESATIASAGLVNERGHIIHAGHGLLTIDSAGYAINNTAGELTSNGSLAVNAASLDNTGGKILTSNGDIDLILDDALTNTDGIIEAADSLTLTAGSLSNRDGRITSLGSDDTALTTTGTLDNTDGTIESNAQNLGLNAAAVINDNGDIVHRGTGKLTVKTTEISNRGGIIASLGRFIATGFTTFYNTILNGNVAEIQADHIELDGEIIDNTGGKLIATGTNSISITANTLTNTDGTVDSAGSLDVDVTQLENSGGLLQAQGILTVELPAFDFSDCIFNGADGLIINTHGELINGVGNQLLTDGLLAINTDGQIRNYGEISTLSDLTLTGIELHNYADAIISAGNDLTLGFISGAITNSGRLSAGHDLFLSAASLTNYGILAAGNNVQTTLTGSLDNYNTLFAANDANFYVSNRLNNHQGANIFAINNIIIAANDNLARSQ